MVTTVTGVDLSLLALIRCVLTGAVATTAGTEHHDAEPQDHDQTDGPNDLLPASYAGGRAAGGAHTGVGVGVARPFSDVRLL